MIHLPERIPVAAAVLTCLLLPSTATAQTIHGVVYLAESDTLIEGATAQLIGPDGIAQRLVVTGRDGAFRIQALGVGRYTLRVRRIGYSPQYVAFTLGGQQAIELRVNLARQVTLLEGVTIFGETAETPEQREFLSRRNLKWGYSFNKKEIEQLHQGTARDVVVMQVPLMRARLRCSLIYLDGRPLRIDLGEFPLDWAYGIEVYKSYIDIPIKYRDIARRRRPCGAVLLWSTTVGNK